jgi:hypothetical protein
MTKKLTNQQAEFLESVCFQESRLSPLRNSLSLASHKPATRSELVPSYTYIDTLI